MKENVASFYPTECIHIILLEVKIIEIGGNKSNCSQFKKKIDSLFFCSIGTFRVLFLF
jgi:hypothetical protein